IGCSVTAWARIRASSAPMRKAMGKATIPSALLRVIIISVSLAALLAEADCNAVSLSQRFGGGGDRPGAWRRRRQSEPVHGRGGEGARGARHHRRDVRLPLH